VRAGLLGIVKPDGGRFRAEWTDAGGVPGFGAVPREPAAVSHVVRHQAGGLRFHDLRHSYATGLVDDGVPVNMVPMRPRARALIDHARSLHSAY
jgi:integrase